MWDMDNYKNKVMLGNGLRVERKGSTLMLTQSDGYQRVDRIILDGEQVAQLVVYMAGYIDRGALKGVIDGVPAPPSRISHLDIHGMNKEGHGGEGQGE